MREICLIATHVLDAAWSNLVIRPAIPEITILAPHPSSLLLHQRVK